jgi:hypothetical protein
MVGVGDEGAHDVNRRIGEGDETRGQERKKINWSDRWIPCIGEDIGDMQKYLF